MFTKYLRRFESASPRTLLGINAGFAAFVGVAHGGALILTYHQPTPIEGMIRTISAVTLPTAVIMLMSAALGAFRRNLLEKVLAGHAIVLVAGAAASVAWATSLAVNGIPYKNFSWTPGVLTLFVCYSLFLYRRCWLARFIESCRVVRHLHLLSILVAFPIEIAVLVRFLQLLHDRFDAF